MLGPLALGLLLGQSAPLRLVPPALLADAPPPPSYWPAQSYLPQLGLEPGTRLLPFNESEPSRGPLAPPPPPGPAPLSAAEWRAVLLARAKRDAPDSSGFKPGPKDPWKAVSLSAEGLLVGILFPPLLSVGPSAGQAYCGQWTQAITTSSIRTVALIAIGAAAYSFGTTLGNSNTNTSQLSSAAGTLDIVLIAGGLVIALASAFDLATAYGQAERANAQWERTVLGEAR
jgi:hypothetical protein